MPQSSPSVLVIRLDGIGDALALTPLLAALRERGTTVDAVLTERNARVFSPTALRHAEIAPFALRSGSAENLVRIAAFGDTLRERGYDAVLVATEDPGGYRLAHRIGAPSVGFANGWGKPFKTLWTRSLLTRTLYRSAGLDAAQPHECAVLYRLGDGLVADSSPTRDLAALRPLVLDDDIARADAVAVQVTQKWQRFGVTSDDVAALVRSLSDAYDVRAIAAHDEAAFADAVERASGVRVERHADLASWKAAVARARALVAPDSGATNLAGMVGTPTVALFPPMRHLDRQIARWHPWAAPYRAIVIERDWQERTQTALQALTSGDRA
jgi:ADP-heptose:LPS heptosyltransferase